MEGMAIQIISSLVDKVIKDMKIGKAPSPSAITAEMLKIPGGVGFDLVTHTVNQVVHEGVIYLTTGVTSL